MGEKNPIKTVFKITLFGTFLGFIFGSAIYLITALIPFVSYTERKLAFIVSIILCFLIGLITAIKIIYKKRS
jgi:ABC-type antimicrobial peptide transport system permease subunit